MSILSKLNLSEPSTHAGIASILLAASLIFPPYAIYLQADAAVFGGAGVLKKEKK